MPTTRLMPPLTLHTDQSCGAQGVPATFTKSLGTCHYCLHSRTFLPQRPSVPLAMCPAHCYLKQPYLFLTTQNQYHILLKESIRHTRRTWPCPWPILVLGVTSTSVNCIASPCYSVLLDGWPPCCLTSATSFTTFWLVYRVVGMSIVRDLSMQSARQSVPIV